jgi:RNA-directed DNA polymerase
LDAVNAVNGTEDSLTWDAIDWRLHEQAVRRLRGRIFTAVKDGDLAMARNLQKLMLRSWSNTLVSVRRVTQLNAGRATAGIDGQVALTAVARMTLARRVHATDLRAWKPRPVRRVHIPKAGSSGKLRPLGIPVLADRVLQARVVSALEPEWEARFEPRSYGFRPGRSCQDAIAALFTTCCGTGAKRLWILDADLSRAFDRIDHDRLLDALGQFPARDLIAAWLKAGVLEPGKGFAPTDEGSPQGGIVSPLLMNVALHGLEEAAGVRYQPNGWVKPGSPVLVRYADDFAVCCHSRQQAERVEAVLRRWLEPRGLSFNEDKTRIAHLSEGVDFLGFTLRRFGPKLIIKPSKAAVSKAKGKLAAEMRRLRGANAATVLGAVAPVVRGWASYYRGVVSKKVFNDLDHHVWALTYKWARWSHPKKGRRWVVDRYFGRFHPARQDRWVFGDRNSGACLPKFAWTKIERHVLVQGAASPDDPALKDYWADRRRKHRPPLGSGTLHLLRKQDGRCALCGDLLLHAEREPHSPQEWEQWHRAVRKAITRSAIGQSHSERVSALNDAPLVHTGCQRRYSDAAATALPT